VPGRNQLVFVTVWQLGDVLGDKNALHRCFNWKGRELLAKTE